MKATSAAERYRDIQSVAAVLKAHRLEPRTGNCRCGWEPASERGADDEHAKHVAAEVVDRT